MKCKLKRKSKRIPTKVRAKAEKKVREHNRKVKKEQRLNPSKFHRKNRTISVPNECPFKETVLKEVEVARKRKEAERVERRARLAEASKAKAGERVKIGQEGGLEGILKEAGRKGEEFEDRSDESDVEPGTSQERSAKTYYKEFAKVVEAADVILQVLDARDPLGTRCAEVEDLVLGQGSGKRLVLVLSKADLVPKENLEAWIKYLRLQLPTIAFKSSTQTQSRRLGHAAGRVSKMSDAQLQTTSKSVGVATLMALLANYCRNRDVKSAIRVGVVGYPNVGKSSLINSLKRGKVCCTGNTPGVTKVMQEIQLDGKIKLLDCPGMVLNTAKGARDDVQVALRNAMKTERLADYVVPVEAILQRCERQYMQLQYNIAEFGSTQEFLALAAKEMGKLKKGGVPDLEAAAKMVLNDWNGGKIKYYTHPPEKQPSVVDAKIIAEYSKEFSLDDLDSRMEEDRQQLPDVLPSETMAVKEAEKVAPPKVSVKKAASRKTQEKVGREVEKLGENAPPKLKRAQKLREKKEKKDRMRRDKLGDELSDILNSAI